MNVIKKSEKFLQYRAMSPYLWGIQLLWLVLILLLVTASSADDLGWPRQTTDFILSSPTAANLHENNADPQQEIIVTSLDDQLYIWNHDGTDFETTSGTFPQPLGFVDGTISSVSVGDVNGDGIDDLVVGGDDNFSKNPKLLIFDLVTFTTTTIALSNTTASLKASVALIDCKTYDNSSPHPALEMLVRDGDGRVYIYAWNGSGYTSLQTWDTATTASQKDSYGSMPITPSVSAVKINTSNTLIVTPSTDGKIYYWRVSSTTSANWTVEASDTHDAGDRFLSSAALADIDDDGNWEILAGSNGNKVYAFEILNDSLSEQWSASTGVGNVVSSPAVADIDVDGDLDVVVGCDDGKVYCFELNGTAKTGWPQATGGDVFASPILAEIDGISGLEVIATSFDKGIYVWKSNGSLVGNWPRKLDSAIYASPLVTDLNGDGRKALVTGSYNGIVSVMELSRKALSAPGSWSEFRNSNKRTGAVE